MGCISPKCKSNNVIPIMYGYPAPNENKARGGIR